MYTCPNCGSHQVTVRRRVVVLESWDGDAVECEYEDDGGRDPEDATAECGTCGEETYDAGEWWAPF